MTVEHIGIVNPMKKVYELSNKLEYMAEFFAIITMHVLEQQLTFNSKINTFCRKSTKSLALDGPHFIVGLLTVFKQYNPVVYKRYLFILSHYYKNLIYNTTLMKERVTDLPADSTNILVFMEELMKFEATPREVVSQNLGTFVFDSYQK